MKVCDRKTLLGIVRVSDKQKSYKLGVIFKAVCALIDHQCLGNL